MKLLKYLLLAALSVSLAFTQAGCQKQQTPPTVDLTSEEAIAEQKKFEEFYTIRNWLPVLKVII